ncbi:uncharacterized protein [Physcomitrium patens]|uniref:SH3 domain-containing protein n=1 Tax=Physcomitrium patens TaxID=3218 RepID=A9RX65_PHYPA|nr:uncharacterized protein LOC112295062 [Physcomitrium patens]PNR35389.1 hypothetical protein PHYPA_023289 [Physcomitrium patens]|eukprot:XP_024401966.1 uncharacterized protein LOC112295062 [Physcomitrella patens]
MASLHQARSTRFAALIILILALGALSFFAAPADAQCTCTRGSMNSSARCWYGGPGSGSYVTVPSGGTYSINCQAVGGSVGGNNYWNRIWYNGRWCYVNDYYMTTGCATKCSNIGCCSGYSC